MFNTLPENKHIGKVTEYDGMFGKIITETKEYIFFNQDVTGDLPVEPGDYVEFRAETLLKDNTTLDVARFVWVHQKGNIIQIPRSK